MEEQQPQIIRTNSAFCITRMSLEFKNTNFIGYNEFEFASYSFLLLTSNESD